MYSSPFTDGSTASPVSHDLAYRHPHYSQQQPNGHQQPYGVGDERSLGGPDFDQMLYDYGGGMLPQHHSHHQHPPSSSLPLGQLDPSLTLLSPVSNDNPSAPPSEYCSTTTAKLNAIKNGTDPCQAAFLARVASESAPGANSVCCNSEVSPPPPHESAPSLPNPHTLSATSPPNHHPMDRGTGGFNIALSTDLRSLSEETDIDMANDGVQQPGCPLVEERPSWLPGVQAYLQSDNRFKHGERSIIISTPKVAQKSYKAEKRYLIPPPSALLIGQGWSTPLLTMHPSLCPSPQTLTALPTVQIAIPSEEPPTKKPTISWMLPTSEALSEKAAASILRLPNPPIYGSALAKQLFITAAGEKDGSKSGVKAKVRVEYAEGVEAGTFESKEIKVVSKPARKKASATSGSLNKGIDLSIPNASLISSYQRTRSQASSTRYLVTRDSTSRVKSTDGQPLVDRATWQDRHNRGLAHPTLFASSTEHWDPLIIWLVDVRTPETIFSPKKSFGPPNPDWPLPPSNAIPVDLNRPVPICYNNAIVFQCPKSGSISPVLIVRKIKEKGIAVGGIPANFDNDTSIDAACCPPGERAGEVVNQMQKVALEVFNRSLIPQSATSPGRSGSFLSVSDQQVHTSCPASKRTFFNEPTPEEVSSASPSSTSPYLPQAAPAPVPGPTPLVAPNLQYAQGNGSPLPDESNNGGRVPTTKRRPSTGSITKRPSSRAGKNISSDSLPLNSGGQTAAAEKTTPSSAVLSEKWWIDAGEAAVWTFIGVESVKYTFYVPPILDSLSDLQYSHISAPVTPLPEVVRYLPPSNANRRVEKDGYTNQYASLGEEEMITIYGKNFNKNPTSSASPFDLLIGASLSPHVELRCLEMMAAVLPPPPSPDRIPTGDSKLSLVRRSDGVVAPGRVQYVG